MSAVDRWAVELLRCSTSRLGARSTNICQQMIRHGVSIKSRNCSKAEHENAAAQLDWQRLQPWTAVCGFSAKTPL